jgi:hypothetical protein
LSLGDRGRITIHNISAPARAFLKPLFQMFDLLSIIVQLARRTLVNTRQCLDADNTCTDRAAVAINVQPDGLKALQSFCKT